MIAFIVFMVVCFAAVVISAIAIAAPKSPYEQELDDRDQLQWIEDHRNL